MPDTTFRLSILSITRIRANCPTNIVLGLSQVRMSIPVLPLHRDTTSSTYSSTTQASAAEIRREQECQEKLDHADHVSALPVACLVRIAVRVALSLSLAFRTLSIACSLYYCGDSR